MKTEVCLKLLDERHFLIPDIERSFEGEHGPLAITERLGDFITTVDVVRQELAVYEDSRMRDMQGILIPHCCGAHLFTLPDGWKAYGLLLEVIPGPSLLHTSPEPSKMAPGAQAALVYSTIFPLEPLLITEDQIRQLRYCTRMLKLCGIEQSDWHAKQVICMPRGEPMTEESETFSYEMVLIDFGFAYARLAGEGYGLLPTSDVAAPTEVLHIELGIAFERLRDHWDWEYMDDER